MTSTNTLLRAVLWPRFLVSAWPWRGIAYSASTAVASAALWLVLAGPLAPLALAVGVLRTGRISPVEDAPLRWAGTYVFVAAGLGLIGVGLLALVGPRLALAVAGVERWRLRLADDAPTPSRRGDSLYPVQVMISDFSRYHVAMAVIAAIVAVVLIAMSVLLWKRFAATASSDRAARRVLGSFGVLAVLSSLLVIVVAVANTATAADAAPALLAFFDGGW
ncbi:hypothetical protein [Dactylosporangium sp. NPDC051484]|uniref:hypothetical protein n=1 Tax=Dactylosporangium sp. NPDC051484 TaxID=3154942 RepID=UPI00344FE30E